ncbi:MAG: trypsin-like peptidase domain-containing protein, partial [Polyangiaceae bacterium]|nr:trypsin-like peptidase domain-containing protein [Polyangiaceae bacterium]
RQGAAPVGAACTGLVPGLDLRAELLETLPSSSEGAWLAIDDARLASLALAKKRLASAAGEPEIAGLLGRMNELTQELERNRAAGQPLAAALQKSYADVEAALDAAAVCQGVDLRVLDAPAGATRAQRLRVILSASPEEKRAQRSKNAVVADAPACAPGRRIVAALGTLDTKSRSSSTAVGQHLAEMTLDGEFAQRRDALSRALLAHAKNLAAFAAFSDPKAGGEAAQTKVTAMVNELDRRAQACVDGMSESGPQVVAGREPPRRIAVLVRPKWPERYANGETDTGVFGSGVVVRWRTASGKVETRVVSNAHVLGTAEDAEILDADRLAAGEKDPPGSKHNPRAWNAKVLRISSDDDVAVLRVDDATGGPEGGVGLRLLPAKEDEAVVAAGFPGIQARPSFQISRGTVSNARFQNATSVFGTYLQHTAAIDPGNSGGPLLDAEGRLLGINTIKIMGRESVGFAIPTARVQLALLRAEDRRQFLPGHANAVCDAFVAALAAPSPHGSVMAHVSLSLYDPDARVLDLRTVAYRDAVAPKDEGPIWTARLTAYARLRTRLEDEGGVPTLPQCAGLRALGKDGGAPFGATFRTRSADHTLQIRDEDGVLRVAEVK